MPNVTRRNFRKKRPYRRKRRTRRGTRSTRRPRSYNVTVRRSLVMPNVCYARLKLNIPLTEYVNIANSDGSGAMFPDMSLCVLQNGLAPFDASGTVGSYQYINGSLGTILPSVGSFFAQGIQQYAPFFTHYYVLSSKVTFHIISTPQRNADPTPPPPGAQYESTWPVMCAAGAFYFNKHGDALDQVDLNDLALTSLINNKGFRIKYIANSGGRNSCRISMARKTTKLSGLRDIKDNPGYRGVLSQNLGSGTFDITNPDEQNYYYLRLHNCSTNPLPYSVSIGISMEFNCCFFGRRLWDLYQQTAVAPPSV